MIEGRVVRTEALPRGARLVVREVGPGDEAALGELYGRLSADDRHRRFFSSFRPPPAFLARWVRVAERGGAGFVAVVERAGTSLVVAEAAYAPLPNGDAELAITVDPAWRGWLGPYLLDLLLESAAARGIPNLEAEVLTDNRRMLAILRARGCATADDGDASTTRVLVGTDGPVPHWPVTEGRRVLVVGATGRWAGAAAARAAGMEVLCCPGPAGRHGRCPVLRGAPCPLADGADAIVALCHADAELPGVLAAHVRRRPGVAVVAVGDPALLPEGVHAAGLGPPPAAVLDALEALLGGLPPPDTPEAQPS